MNLPGSHVLSACLCWVLSPTSQLQIEAFVLGGKTFLIVTNVCWLGSSGKKTSPKHSVSSKLKMQVLSLVPSSLEVW